MSKRQIETLIAFVADESEFTGPTHQGEGIVAFMTPAGAMPLVTSADGPHVESMRAAAQSVADAMGITIRVAKFTVREELAPVIPKSS